LGQHGRRGDGLQGDKFGIFANANLKTRQGEMWFSGLSGVNRFWPGSFFEFEFSVLNYTRPENNGYAYFLEGFETEWNRTGPLGYGKYTNLPGGRYTLRLFGSNNDGVWNKEGTAIRIQVDPPP